MAANGFNHEAADINKTEEYYKNLPKSIGKNIRFFRNKNNFTLEELAENVGISVDTIKRYERGSNINQLLCVRRLADVLGVSLDDLIPSELSEADTTVKLRAVSNRLAFVIAEMENKNR